MKDKKSLTERLKIVDSVSAGLNKEAGKVIVGRLSKADELRKQLDIEFIPTPSIEVNNITGGGFPVGNITIAAGKEDSGKTGILLETIAENQRKNESFIALWLESENSINTETLNMFGIDRERFIWLDHERSGAGEQAINRLETLISSGVIDMAVINSLKALVPSEEFKKGMNESTVALQARMNAKMMRKLTATVSQSNTAMVIVQHLTTTIGGNAKGDPLIVSGGLAIKYGAALILDMRKISITAGKDIFSKEEAMKVTVRVRKNHVVTNRYPYLQADYYVIYGEGIEKYAGLIELAVSQGVLSKKGAYYGVVDENGETMLFDDGSKMQWQGLTKIRNYCKENPNFVEWLKEQTNLSDLVQTMSEEEIDECITSERQESELINSIKEYE